MYNTILFILRRNRDINNCFRIAPSAHVVFDCDCLTSSIQLPSRFTVFSTSLPEDDSQRMIRCFFACSPIFPSNVRLLSLPGYYIAVKSASAASNLFELPPDDHHLPFKPKAVSIKILNDS